MYKEMKRCWALKGGHDKWLRPFEIAEEKEWRLRSAGDHT